jgi:hypothetical protein
LIDRAKGLPQLAFCSHTPCCCGADHILCSFNVIIHLQQALCLCIERSLRRRNEHVQFGQTIGADELFCNRGAITIGGKAVPAAQPACQCHQTFARCEGLTIIRFDHTHHRQSRGKLCRGINKMDQGRVGDLAQRSGTAKPATSRFATYARICVVAQRSGQSAFIAWLDRYTVDRFVALALGQGTLQCALFGQ